MSCEEAHYTTGPRIEKLLIYINHVSCAEAFDECRSLTLQGRRRDMSNAPVLMWGSTSCNVSSPPGSAAAGTWSPCGLWTRSNLGVSWRCANLSQLGLVLSQLVFKPGGLNNQRGRWISHSSTTVLSGTHFCFAFWGMILILYWKVNNNAVNEYQLFFHSILIIWVYKRVFNCVVTCTRINWNISRPKRTGSTRSQRPLSVFFI